MEIETTRHQNYKKKIIIEPRGLLVTSLWMAEQRNVMK